MKIYNSLTKKKEEFIPIDKENVKMYACGITVYDDSHIGHARQAITYDMICCYLRFIGYNVKYVRNYTDVDDKIIARANALNVNALDYSEARIKDAEDVFKKLGADFADVKAKASENIDNIIDFVSKLIEKGYAYSTEKGDVYFSVKSFANYGKLSNISIDDLLNGVRKEVEEGKRDPIDFALWKSAKPGEISWKSPWGEGRPGWHIECSTMVLNNLGETIDIHGGGKDLVFPHHENEIAQSEALTGKPLANYWIHNGLIKINGQKMSKSLGNSLTIKQALEKYNPEVIRYAMVSKSYSADIDLGEKEFALAEQHLYYFYNTMKSINKFIEENFEDGDSIFHYENTIVDSIEKEFIEAMNDDFNTPVVIANLFSTCKYINNVLKNNKMDVKEKIYILNKIKSEIIKCYNVIGLFKENINDMILELKNKYLLKLKLDVNFIEEQVKNRLEAKLEKNYVLADAIRNDLEEQGIILNDTKEKTEWDIKELYSLS
ncbi:MAG: cysteine--tRNA ligase [Clostridiales bacterium]|nr:cysteine--tRNA ligase [Clostridiales bacterium]